MGYQQHANTTVAPWCVAIGRTKAFVAWVQNVSFSTRHKSGVLVQQPLTSLVGHLEVVQRPCVGKVDASLGIQALPLQPAEVHHSRRWPCSKRLDGRFHRRMD